MTPEIRAGFSERFNEPYENITGDAFDKANADNITTCIEINVGIIWKLSN